MRSRLFLLAKEIKSARAAPLQGDVVCRFTSVTENGINTVGGTR